MKDVKTDYSDEQIEMMKSLTYEDHILWLNKGRGLPTGTVRDRKRGKYIKRGDGKWVPHKGGDKDAAGEGTKTEAPDKGAGDKAAWDKIKQIAQSGTAAETFQKIKQERGIPASVSNDFAKKYGAAGGNAENAWNKFHKEVTGGKGAAKGDATQGGKDTEGDKPKTSPDKGDKDKGEGELNQKLVDGFKDAYSNNTAEENKESLDQYKSGSVKGDPKQQHHAERIQALTELLSTGGNKAKSRKNTDKGV